MELNKKAEELAKILWDNPNWGYAPAKIESALQEAFKAGKAEAYEDAAKIAEGTVVVKPSHKTSGPSKARPSMLRTEIAKAIRERAEL